MYVCIYMYIYIHAAVLQPNYVLPALSIESVLQRVAACCSVLRCVAVCCSVLQCVAVCCSVMQCAAAPLGTACIQHLEGTEKRARGGTRSILKYVVVCCSMLQYVAMCFV